MLQGVRQGNNRKAFACFAGTRCFYRCVERKDIGLESNILNNLDYFRNLM